MKKEFIIFYVLIFANAAAAEMTSQEVLEKSLEALGGRQKLQAIRSYTASGKVEVAGLVGT